MTASPTFLVSNELRIYRATKVMREYMYWEVVLVWVWRGINESKRSSCVSVESVPGGTAGAFAP